MRLNAGLLLLLGAITTASRLLAGDALYTVRIAASQSFEVLAGPAGSPQLSFYSLDGMMAQGMKKGMERKVIAANYAVGFLRIRTKEPHIAVQDIANQISRQTGLKLKTHVDGSLARIAPTTILQAFSDSAVITLVLTPQDPDVYLVSCSYLIDERPAGSNDGTPAAIAEMVENIRLMTADSTAASLPAKLALGDIKPGEYFRGALQFNLPGSNDTFFPVVVLMLKKDNDYTVGLYRNEEGRLTMLDQPVALSGTWPPFVTNLPNDPPLPAGTPLRASQIRMGLRANNITGTGGCYISFENGRVSKQEF